jgi:hypothetical protein
MKHLLISILLTCAIMLACPFSAGVGTGGQASALLDDPQVGLASLDNYHAALKISFQGTLNGDPVELTDTYLQSEWPRLAAKFTAIDTTDASGGHQAILAGAVGEAQYFQADSSSPCTVDWGAAAGGPSQFRPASLLPAVGAASLAGEETIDNIATRHYTFDAASMGLPADTTAKGEVWIAKDGGYVMKYVLDITGSDSYFGTGAQGTRHVEYLLSEIGVHPEVVYPAGCAPVLTDTDAPAMNDATDLIRLPGLLGYNTSAKAEAILAFYTDKLTPQGWEKISEDGLGTDSAMVTFARTSTGALAFVDVTLEGDSERVTVMIPNPGSAKATTTSPDTTPGGQATTLAGNPSVRVALAPVVLFGMVPKQPGPASYHLEVTHQAPVWSGGKIAQSQEDMSADVQGKDVHFTHRKTIPGGSTTASEAYLIGDQEFVIVNGKTQPPAANSMTWNLWSLNLITFVSGASSGATAAGTEMLEGRTAEIYELNSTGLSIPGVTGSLIPITSLTGKIWVDQQTGALVKAVLDYQADVRDTAGNMKGGGSGHLEIIVTQIGNVTVTVPK